MSAPQPTLSPLTRPYWEALNAGSLTFQRCEECEHAWLPAREACPSCLSPRWVRTQAAGTGRVVSWVIYHIAYAEHLAARIPYNVAVVKLEEGPRMLTSIVDCDSADLRIDACVKLKVTEENGLPLPYFVLAEADEEVGE
ncbi:Zn-ribbon domain-containing OB-fold protein [Sinorhizobium meliloti]|uniref:DNA-binding protein n=1 Tax=Rhizobium meliloti TaxID=382 RepID=A0A2J0YU04_RHIML|nr:OB-fold domain-containing protein [Sinorhizobium meliloti]PJR09882.1 DNA-binding protein [Sinorhizobium meliloti]